MGYNIYILDQTQWRVWFAGQTLNSDTIKRVKDWGIENGAELCFNLGIFKMIYENGKLVKGNGLTYVHTPTGDLGYGGESNTLPLISGYSCKGYSNGIVNGMVLVNAPLGGTSRRNGIGLTKSNKVIIAQSTSSVTEKTFASAVNNYVTRQGEAVSLFVLQDGGGSTTEYSSISKLAFHATGEDRPVTTVVCAKRIAMPKVTRTLKLWCKGEDVKLLQTVLGGIEADGSYGFGTRSRVIQAQKALGLVADGSCGPITQKALGLR